MKKEGRLIKSKKRVRDFGEVFTPEWLVRDMCALIPDEMYDLNHTFLEPSCGNGNFLVHILERKLKNAESPRCALLALSCLYGVDILEDNVNECKKRLLTICESFPNWDIEIHSPIATKILDKQIICGDFLKGDLPTKKVWREPMLDTKTLEWLEARKNPNYFCKTYCPWFRKIDNSEKCTIPLMPCVFIPSPYETNMAEDFDRTVAERVEMYLHEDMPCIHSRNILCCPQCYTDKNFEFVTRKKPNNYIKCGTDCLTRTARIELEDEWDEALISFYNNTEGENEAD